jgi:hypothetical protein
VELGAQQPIIWLVFVSFKIYLSSYIFLRSKKPLLCIFTNDAGSYIHMLIFFTFLVQDLIIANFSLQAPS